MGTFKGYGGYVGIYPYRELGVGATALQIGRLVEQLLAKSGPTGVHIRDHSSYEASAADDRTRATCEWAAPAGLTTSSSAKRFLQGGIETQDKSKSRLVYRYEYDPSIRSLVQVEPGERVRKSAGAEALGEQIRRMLWL